MEAETIRTEAAEEAPSTGDGLERNVGEEYWNEIPVLVALDVFVRLPGDYAADGGGVGGDGGCGAGAEGVGGGYGETNGEDENES